MIIEKIKSNTYQTYSNKAYEGKEIRTLALKTKDCNYINVGANYIVLHMKSYPIYLL